MPCIELVDAQIKTIRAIKYIVSNPFINTADYRLSNRAGAFVQGYDESNGWILVEFWQPDYLPFVTHVIETLQKIAKAFDVQVDDLIK